MRARARVYVCVCVCVCACVCVCVCVFSIVIILIRTQLYNYISVLNYCNVSVFYSSFLCAILQVFVLY